MNLHNGNVKEIYVQRGEARLMEQNCNKNNVEIQWNDLRKCLEAAMQQIRRVGKKKKDCKYKECYKAIQEKSYSRLKWLRRNQSEHQVRTVKTKS